MKYLAITLLSVTLSGLGNSAQGEPESWLLAKYDLDGDAQISAAEIAEKKSRLFTLLDRNGDGDVAFEEYQSADQSRRLGLLQTRFNKLDTDQNGLVSSAEYASYMGLFNRFDNDGDGRLSRDEVQQQKHTGVDDTYCLLWLCLRTDLP